MASDGPHWKKPLMVWGGLGVLLILLAIIPLERRVGSACEVEAGSRFTVTAPSSGTLETELFIRGSSERRERSVIQAAAADFSVVAYNLHVQEGDSVRVGDTLVAMSSNRYQAELLNRTAEQERVIAERNLLLSGPKKDEIAGLRAELSELEAQMRNKQIELERAQRMWDGQLISREEFEAKETELDVALAQREAKKSELALLISGPKAEQLAIKEAQIAGLDAEVGFLRTQIAASTIVAPIDGLVTRVQRADVLIEIADLDPVRLRLWVDQDDIADVGIAAQVTLKVRSRPYTTFYGRTAGIAGDADTLDGRRHFVVITEIENSDHLLRPGMTGYGKIACGKRPALALIVRRMVQFIRVEFWSWW